MTKTCLIGCALLISGQTASADVVVDWNIQAGQTIGAGARRGPSGSFDFAMVHAAMHDAVQAFEHRFEPYCADIPKASGSPIAAAAAAAHAVLSALFPAQAAGLDAAYDASVAKYMVQGDAGALIGQQAAACVLGRLTADNLARAVPDSFLGGHGPGEWRPTTITPAGVEVPMIGGFVALIEPFAMKSSSQFRASAPPPHLTSGAYAKAYEEVKTLGARVGSTRTQEQTNIAAFFADAPAGYWNRTVQALTASHSLDLGESARLFALLNMALADAVIATWDSKVAWNFWRPVTAIRQGDADGNPRTIGDTAWTPLFNTPNYPDYTSGANNGAGAATEILSRFFGGDQLDFTLTSNTIAAPDNVRHYRRISDAARDVVDARIYMGIHFRFADTVALRQGSHVAAWVFTHFLRPIGTN